MKEKIIIRSDIAFIETDRSLNDYQEVKLKDYHSEFKIFYVGSYVDALNLIVP